MRILITGANGQVGHEFSLLSSNSPHEIICKDRQQLNIADKLQVDAVIKALKPDVVINTAAYTAVDKAESDADNAQLINAEGPRFLAKACAENHAALIHISTDYVFTGNTDTPYKESDVTGPTGVYGASKLKGELAVIEALDRHIILRTAWVFGAHGNNFVKTMLRLGADRDELGIVADQWGAPTSARGIAATCIAIAEQIITEANHWGIYHYSGAPYTNWHGFATAIFDRAVDLGLLSKAPKLNAISSDQFPTPAKRPSNSRLDCSKLASHFGIQADDWMRQLDTMLSELKQS